MKYDPAVFVLTAGNMVESNHEEYFKKCKISVDKTADVRYNVHVLKESKTFLSSSMAEHSAVNRRVVGSSPTWGAT